MSAIWAQYIQPGYILYIDLAHVLQAVALDLKRLETTGSFFPLLENVDSFDISNIGILLRQIKRTDSVLDVGCGDGPTTSKIAALAGLVVGHRRDI